MLQLETNLHGTNGTMRARVQTVFKMIQHWSAQQLTYLLRTCPAHNTLHAARRLDTAIANTINRIMDCVPLLPYCHASYPQSRLPSCPTGRRWLHQLRSFARGCLCCIHDLLWTYDAHRCSHSWLFWPCCSKYPSPARCHEISARTGRSMHTNSGLYPSLDTSPASELVAKLRTAAIASLPTGEPRNGLSVLRPLTPGNWLSETYRIR
jgi:hypothetical protein